MKNKLLKSTILVSLAAPLIAGISSCANNTTSVNNVKQETKASGPLTASTKYTITFEQGTADKIEGPMSVKARSGATFGSVEQPIATKDKRPQSYWIDQNGNKVVDSTVINGPLTLKPYFEADIQLKNCLSVIALEHTKFNVTHFGDHITTKPDLLYSTDGFKWQQFGSDPIDILPGSAIYLRGNNPTGFNKDMYNYSQFTMAGTVHLNGSAMSLIDNGMGTATTIPNDYCFARMFEGCSGVKVISSAFLPATTLKPHCYEALFKNCTNLEAFPNYLLKATTLATRCYADMFTNCTSLKAIPSGLLSYATTLSEECYFQMFRGCTGLTNLPDGTLPATTLAKGCYEGMFRGCSRLISTHDTPALGDNLLPATTLQPYCYYGMFESCIGLTDLSAFNLPAGVKVGGTAVGSLADYCYKSMFYNCTLLDEPPKLDAETLKEGCYYAMFYNCTSLLDAPELPAETMQKECYAYMFYNCTTIIEAPDLPALNLAYGCYRGMFYNCTSLEEAPDTLQATIYYPYCYEEMFYNCSSLGTAPTFPDGTVNLYPSGASGGAIYCCQKMFAKSGITASPKLTAETAAEGCYRNMFDGCASLITIGEVKLETLADYACYMMYVRCSAVTINEHSSKQTNHFFKCPSTTGLTDPTRSMFQETKGATGGKEAEAGKYYDYS